MLLSRHDVEGASWSYRSGYEACYWCPLKSIELSVVVTRDSVASIAHTLAAVMLIIVKCSHTVPKLICKCVALKF